MKYAMKIKNLLSVLHVVTWVKIFYKHGSMVAFGYPMRLYEDLSDEIMNLQVIDVIACGSNQINVVVNKGKTNE